LNETLHGNGAKAVKVTTALRTSVESSFLGRPGANLMVAAAKLEEMTIVPKHIQLSLNSELHPKVRVMLICGGGVRTILEDGHKGPKSMQMTT